MSIQNTDIKLLKSERLTDEADGGGRATGSPVIDGVSNNLFPDISRLDRTVGKISLRKAFGGPVVDTDEPYMGVHSIITEPPADARVSALLFKTGSHTDERRQAQDAIESYVAAATSAPFELLGTQLAGQRSIAVVQREEQRPPEVGDVFKLITASAEQFVRVTEVTQKMDTFVYEYTGTFSNFTRRRCDLKLTGPLLYKFPGGTPTPAGTTGADLGGLPKAQVLSTQVADAARYYGVSKLSEAVAEGALSIRVQSVYSQLVPSTTKEQALVALYAGQLRGLVLAAGPARTVSLTVAAAATAGESKTYLGTGCARGSLTITVNGGTYADNRAGALNWVSGAQWLSRGSVDYETGEISLVRSGSSFTGSASAIYQPGAVGTSETISGEIAITNVNRGYVYTLDLSEALPRAGTVSVSYMALGKWYDLRDMGDGLMVGEGSGTVDFASGAVSITLSALPDAGTSIIYSYVSSADNDITSHAGGAVTPELRVRKTLGDGGVKPGSVAVTYAVGGTTKTLTDDGKGTLSGTGGTGVVSYAAGTVDFLLASTPSAGIAYAWEKGGVTTNAHSSAADGSGMVTFTIPGAPLKAGSVQASWVTTRRRGVPQSVNRDDKNGAASGVYEATYDVSNTASDNGNGGWQGGRLGTIDYSTGVVTLQAAALYDYVEYQYRTKLKGGREDWYLSATTTPTRELFAGTLTSASQPASVTTSVESDSQANPPLTIELLPGIGKNLVPGSLAFIFAGSVYVERSGVLYRDINSATNGGIACGTVDYASRTATLTSYPAGASGAVTILSALAASVGFALTKTVWRTAGAPLRPASTQISAVRLDTGATVTATADVSGNFNSGIIHGAVDAVTGICRVRFTTDPADDTGASEVAIVPSTLRYNAVAQTRLPLDAGLLGMDPVRLPADGRVPIYREGDVLVIHHTAETPVSSPTAGGTVTLSRSGQAAIEVVGSAGNSLRASSYSVDRDAGTVTWANPLVLQTEDGSVVSLPLTIRDRVEHMTLCTEVQITGELALASPMPWPLPNTARVSSALTWGDLQARVHTWFTQQTWSTGAPNWTDAPVGNGTTANYNKLAYPPAITNAGGIAGKWALVFTGTNTFNVVEEKLGVITTGNTTSDCAPINPLTSKPYFLIKKEGWGSGWAAGNAVRFNTTSALGPMWVIRTVISGKGTVDNDQFKIQIRGDAD